MSYIGMANIKKYSMLYVQIKLQIKNKLIKLIIFTLT